MSIVETTEMGRLVTLRALRDRLAAEIDKCRSDRALAPLVMRLTDVLEQIDELDPPAPAVVLAKETGLSDFEKRLRTREQQATGSRRTKSG